nr:hypothetical protein [Nocardia araoensis]
MGSRAVTGSMGAILAMVEFVLTNLTATPRLRHAAASCARR